MKKYSLALIVVAIFLLAACKTTGSNTFTSEAGGFSIVSPLPMEESVQSVDTELGTIDVHFFMAEQVDRAYLVGYSDYPQDFIDQSDPQVLLDGARDGAVGNISGTLVAEARIELDSGYPGREILVTAMLDQDQEGTLKGRMYMVGNRLYQIMVVAPTGDLSEQEMNEFISSFKLLNP